MEDAEVRRRLDVIIVLLLCILGVLLWPVLPKVVVLAGGALFLGLGIAVVWGLSRAYR